MPRIIPIRDLKDTTAISQMCNESDEPVYITKNGYGVMVIMSMKAYEEMFENAAIDAAIMKAEAEFTQGNKLCDAKETLSSLRKKLWLMV